VPLCREREDQNPLVSLPENVLVVVSCTKTKIWTICPDAPRFVPACRAYRGQKFLAYWSCLEGAIRSGREDLRWLVPSAKYGYIAPEHPGRTRPGTGPSRCFPGVPPGVCTPAHANGWQRVEWGGSYRPLWVYRARLRSGRQCHRLTFSLPAHAVA